MKNSKKQNIQQIAINYQFDIDIDEFETLYDKCSAKPYSILFIDTTLPWDSSFRFCFNLL